jgi:hypothetical protein
VLTPVQHGGCAVRSGARFAVVGQGAEGGGGDVGEHSVDDELDRLRGVAQQRWRRRMGWLAGYTYLAQRGAQRLLDQAGRPA